MSGDCGFSANYSIGDKAGKIELLFFRVTAEVLNGQTNCGFGYVKTKVDKAEVNGVALNMREANGDYFYTAPKDFDPRKNVVTIQLGSSRYVSDPATVRGSEKSINFALRRDN